RLRRGDRSRHRDDPRHRGLQRDRRHRGSPRGRAGVQREAQATIPGQVAGGPGSMAVIPLSLTDEQRALRDSVNDICKRYPGEYWRELDAKREYPEAFVNELTKAGYLGCLIPE